MFEIEKRGNNTGEFIPRIKCYLDNFINLRTEIKHLTLTYMDQILDAPVSAERNLNYAGFWIRVAAIIIDGIILWLVNFILSLIMMGGFTSTEIDSSFYLYFSVAIIIYVFYFPVMESSEKQATLGKMAVGIKVGNSKGERLSFMNALGRFFAKILSNITLYIGYMMAGWDPKKQALHDKLANTYVFYA